jgi:hypothetical protein
VRSSPPSALLAAALGSDIATAPTTISPTTLPRQDYAALARSAASPSSTISGAPFAVVRTSDYLLRRAVTRICPHQGNIVNQERERLPLPGPRARFSATAPGIGGRAHEQPALHTPRRTTRPRHRSRSADPRARQRAESDRCKRCRVRGARLPRRRGGMRVRGLPELVCVPVWS